MLSTLLVVLALGGLVAWLVARSRGRARMRAARDLATELIPEICALIDSSDPKGRSEGESVAAKRYNAERERLPQLLPNEPLCAVETFYSCVESYGVGRGAPCGREGDDIARGGIGCWWRRGRYRRHRCRGGGAGIAAAGGEKERRR